MEIPQLKEQLLRNSFEYFCKLELKSKLGEMHKEWIDLINNNKKHLCLVAPRGHFKTTTLSVAFPLWKMYREHEPKIFLILSATLEQSTEIMQQIKRHIVENKELREKLYPDTKTKWTETHIKTKNGHRVLCIPFSDAVRGKHPDYLILDDVLKTEVMSDVEYSKRVFYGVCFPTINARRGKIIVVGTPTSYVDLLSDLSKKDNFIYKKYQAVITDSSGKWIRPIFPEHFDLDQLREIKQTMPSHLWSREYMCNPVSGDSALFPKEVVNKAVELHNSISKIYNSDSYNPLLYIGCDIAVSESKRADFSVFTIIEKIDGQPAYVKDVVRKHLNTEGNIKEIKRLGKIYNPKRIVVESTGVGWGVAEKLKANDSEVRDITLSFDTKRVSKERILGRLEVMLRNGELAIPNNDILIQELSEFALKKKESRGSVKYTYEGLGEHDDTVMSLALALEAGSKVGYTSATLV